MWGVDRRGDRQGDRRGDVWLGSQTLVGIASLSPLGSASLQPSAGGMVNNDKMHTAILTFSKSLAGYSVATFVLVSKTHQSSGGRTRLT